MKRLLKSVSKCKPFYKNKCWFHAKYENETNLVNFVASKKYILLTCVKYSVIPIQICIRRRSRRVSMF